MAATQFFEYHRESRFKIQNKNHYFAHVLAIENMITYTQELFPELIYPNNS